ncbi:GGDEF domain-containing protein [Janthinobacterium sp. SUN118]|uniref:GGDEF domain-containing protein n=1 Tax=Janthinobacterium sp. SUN118 TaxID=3004100 RepID=UPI0025B17681|nr:GGDEF domain-containing protein [Janthinobacterium sp. SUN118]
MRLPSMSTLRRVAVPLAFGGNSEQQHTYFAELHRVGMVTQVLGIIAYSLTWLLMPAPFQPNLTHAVLALLGMLASLVVRYRCTTLPVLTITGACAVLALTFGLRTMADAVQHASFWVLPVGVFMTLAIASIFNGGLSYLAVVAGVWWNVGHGLYPVNAGLPDESWAPLMIAVSVLFGLALNVSFSLLRLRNYHAKQELMRLAFQDSLTGINNRRMFTQRAQQMHGAPHGGMLHFLMIDIDNFKVINDQQGHDAGDEVLMRTAAIIADKAQGHLCGRLGGEEFGIVYAGDRDAVCAFAGSLVEAVSQGFLAVQFVSISVGVAELDRSKELGHSYRLADEALYLAKRQGKNRYVIV